MENKEIKFIADRYKKGRFSTDKAWNSLGIRPFSIWRKYRVAAAVSAAVVLTASAAIIYKASTAPSISSGTEVTAPIEADKDVVKAIDFENTPLTVVVEKINETYNVKVTGLPESPEEYRLSLHYEGTASDLVETINEILGTELTVKNQ